MYDVAVNTRSGGVYVADFPDASLSAISGATGNAYVSNFDNTVSVVPATPDGEVQ